MPLGRRVQWRSQLGEGDSLLGVRGSNMSTFVMNYGVQQLQWAASPVLILNFASCCNTSFGAAVRP